MVIYIDLLFLLNFVANYLLLLGSGRISGAILQRWRIALSAGAGAIYAVLLFVPKFQWLILWPYKILSGIMMTLIAFWGERFLFRTMICFFGVSVGLAGVIFGVELIGGTGLTVQNGVLYSNFDLRLILLIFIACYSIMSLFFRRNGRHSTREMIPLDIRILGRSVQLTALLDSGHTLADPGTNRPVVVANVEQFLWCIPDKINLFQPVEAIKCCREFGLHSVRLIPYRAVGVDCGMLLAIKADAVFANNKNLGSLLIAFSPTPVDVRGEYQALIGGI